MEGGRESDGEREREKEGDRDRDIWGSTIPEGICIVLSFWEQNTALT